MKFLIVLSVLIFSGSANVVLAQDDPAIMACELELKHSFTHRVTEYERLSATVSSDKVEIGYVAAFDDTRKHKSYTCSFVLNNGRFLLADDRDWYPKRCKELRANSAAIIKSIESRPGSIEQKQEALRAHSLEYRICSHELGHFKRKMGYYKSEVTDPLKALNIYPIAPSDTKLSVPQ